MTTPSTFWDALELDEAMPPVVAIVGGGGKTSLVYRLGLEAQQRGVTAVMAGTTRFTPPPPKTALEAPIVEGSHDELMAAVAGVAPGRGLILHTGPEPRGRLGAIEPATADAIAGTPGVGLVVLEADGSKMRPFKAPAEHEPVIPSSATHVVAVVGLRALDQPIDEEHVHRPECVRAIAGEEPVASTDVIARVLLDPRGGRKGVGERRFTVLVNQADVDPERALKLGRTILGAGAPRVIVASLRDNEAPIRAVLEA